MRIQTNVESLNAYRNLGNTNKAMSNSMEKLSSGFRINRASDDAAGLAISEKMRGQVRGLNQATRNAQDANSMIQTAEGALNESHEILQRMRELGNQAANDTNTAEDRQEIQKEVDQLASELSRITNTTEFNTQNLLSGAFEGNNFQVGANEDQSISLDIGAMDAESLGMAEDVESVQAEVAETSSGIVGAEFTSDSYFEEGDYTVEINDAGDEAQLIKDGETVATTTGTLDVTTGGATITFNLDDDMGTLELYTETGNDLSGITETITLGSSGAELEGTNSGGLSAVQVDDEAVETLGEGESFKIEMTNSVGSSSSIAILDQDNNVLGEIENTNDLSSQYAASGEAETVTLDDGGEVTFTFGDIADVAGDGTYNSEFNVSESDYESGMSSAAEYEDGEITEDANVAKGIDVQTHENATEALTKIDAAIEQVSSQRSELGSLQNRLDHTIANLEVSSENLEAAESRIRDVDMAKEMTNFSKQQILEQAGTAMLAQANQAPQSVLQLLG